MFDLFTEEPRTLGCKQNGTCLNALPKLSKELVWKIWFELAQIEHRRGLIAESNAAYVQGKK